MYGGSSEFRMLVDGGFQVGAGGAQIFLHTSSDPSTGISAVTGFFSGAGAVPSTYSAASPGVFAVGGKSPGFWPVGLYIGDIVLHVENAQGPRPSRATWHVVQNSTANFSTAALTSTAGFDITLSSASTA